MKTKSDQKRFAIAHRIILHSFVFAIATFTAYPAFASTNTLQVNLKVRFVQLQPFSDWPDTLGWYMLASFNSGGRMFTTKLTDSEFKTVLRKLEQRDGADLINEAQVTTVNGKKAKFQIPDVQTNADNARTQNAGVTAKSDSKNNPDGTTLDLLPTVSDEDSTIQIDLIPTVTEFLETNESGAFIPKAITNGLTLPLPHTRIRQTTLSTSLKDGQTVVLLAVVLGPPDKANGTASTKLLIFVTPTLIDSFGHRIHSEDYYDSPLNGGFGRGGGGFRGGGFGQ